VPAVPAPNQLSRGTNGTAGVGHGEQRHAPRWRGGVQRTGVPAVHVLAEHQHGGGGQQGNPGPAHAQTHSGQQEDGQMRPVGYGVTAHVASRRHAAIHARRPPMGRFRGAQ